MYYQLNYPVGTYSYFDLEDCKMFVGGHSLVAWCTGAENRESAQLELKATPPRHNRRGNQHFWSFLLFCSG